MENVSKALLIAGGVLIGVIIIGALILMHNQISGYNQTQTISKAQKEIVIFNKQFTKYTDDEQISGAQLIDLIHKVQDYNKRGYPAGTIDENKKITLEITLTNEYKNKYIKDGNMLFTHTTFQTEPYVIKDGQKNEFEEDIEFNFNLELKHTISALKKALSDENNNIITTGQKEGYRKYSEFKNSIFKPNEDLAYYDDNGQIQKLSFIYKK